MITLLQESFPANEELVHGGKDSSLLYGSE